MAINTDPWSPLDDWVAYWKSKGASADGVTFATDSDQSVVRGFKVITLGTTIIIDRNGRISYRDDGATPYETLRAQVQDVF